MLYAGTDGDGVWTHSLASSKSETAIAKNGSYSRKAEDRRFETVRVRHPGTAREPCDSAGKDESGSRGEEMAVKGRTEPNGIERTTSPLAPFDLESKSSFDFSV